MNKLETINLYLWQPDLSGCHFQEDQRYTDSLSSSEQHILHQISSTRRKEEYIAGHYFVKQLINHHYNHDIELIHHKNQAPYVASNPALPPPPLFNLSHTQNTIACCISHTLQAGIDIEHQKSRRNVLAIAKNYFTTQEHKQLSTLAGQEQLSTFYRLWTLKESYLKSQRHDNHAAMLSSQFITTPNPKNRQWQCLYSEVLDKLHLAISIPSDKEIELHSYLLTETIAETIKQASIPGKPLRTKWQTFYPTTEGQ